MVYFQRYLIIFLDTTIFSLISLCRYPFMLIRVGEKNVSAHFPQKVALDHSSADILYLLQPVTDLF